MPAESRLTPQPSGLSPFRRAVLVLRGAHALTAEEVARVLNTSRERVMATTYLT
jgi:DNA-directed RNA polymerase specialized sigma24 family protein